MLDELCEQKHESIEEKFIRHEKRLDEHEVKIDNLEKSDAINSTEIKNLCSQIGSQTKAIWGLVLMVGTSLVGFFFYAIQQHIFK